MARELEAPYDTPKERLVGAFEVQGLSFTEPEAHAERTSHQCR
jgi:hypothetical protein